MNALEKMILPMIGESLESPDVFTDDVDGMKPIRDSINFAIAELCSISGTYTSEYLLPLYTGRQFYRMNWTKDWFGYVVNCWDPSRRLRLRGTTVEILKNERPSFLDDSGDPTQYFQVGRDVIGLDRSPSGGGRVLHIRCVAIPKPYTYGDEPVKIREHLQRAIAYHAASEFFASRGDAVRAKEFYEKYVEVAGIQRVKTTPAQQVYVMGKPNGDI